MNARKQYLEELRKEYRQADEVGRGRLLGEAGKRTWLNREYLIRVLNHPQPADPRKRGDAVGGMEQPWSRPWWRFGISSSSLRSADGSGAEQ
jgi:hypothetical protein